MQLFLRDSGSLVLNACEHTTIAELKAAYAARKTYGIGTEQALVLLHNGRQLQDDATLAEAALYHGATLSVCSRLLGGGGDGGSTGAESRSCYLEMYAQRKPDKVNPLEELLARSTRCRLSGERLTPPCVADELGSLFNKEALVHALLNKTMPAALAHIASLKSVVNLKLEPAHKSNGSSSKANGSKANSSSSSDAADFQCPVTGLELNGRFPFVIHRPTGQVLSERALREAPAAVEELLGGKWAADDLIPVNPQGEELEKRQQAVAAALAAERARKKAKKAGKEKEKAAAAAAVTGAGGAGAAAEAADGAADGAAAVVGSKRPPMAPPAGAAAAGGVAAAKKLKLPAGATPEVYASIFSTGQPKVKETFCCRSASGRGLGM